MPAKRKAAAALPSSTNDEATEPVAKKQKASGDKGQPNIEDAGLAFLAQLNNTRDKQEHQIAEKFYELPDREKHPDYYQKIGLPISINMIEAKIRNGEYINLIGIESDMRRLISNAKTYNNKSSSLFSDAEKIRKMLSNYMIKNNPAYKTGKYIPMATPVPDKWGPPASKAEEEEGEEDSEEEDAEGETDNEVPPTPAREAQSAARSSVPSTSDNRGPSATPAVQDPGDDDEGFEGKDFQQAQEKIVMELINLKNEDDELISGNFINLPSRELRDYYQLIKHPVSLKRVQKLVRGITGRDRNTGKTIFKSWQSFEEEINHIWSNARLYNEDQSLISQTAGVLEKYFQKRLAEAKRVVDEPPQPKVKLKMSAPPPSDQSSKVFLRLGGSKGGGSGVAVDSEALKRQQQLVNAGASMTGRNRVSQERTSNSSADRPSSAVNGIKKEIAASQSPRLATAVTNGDSKRVTEGQSSPGLAGSSMPPPSASGQSSRPFPSNFNPYNSVSAVPAQDSRWRQSGKGVDDALISNLSISTHKGLKLDKDFHIDIPPDPITTQQSITLNLPKTHYFLNVSPTRSAATESRLTKWFVSVNNQRINPSPQPSDKIDNMSPVYEVRLYPGVMRIEIELAAGLPRGAPKVGSGPDLETEKITVFVHLSKY